MEYYLYLKGVCVLFSQTDVVRYLTLQFVAKTCISQITLLNLNDNLTMSKNET